MVKKATSPWLRGLLKAGKQQQRMLTVMLAPPKPAKVKAKPRPRPAAVPAPVEATPPAPGKWLADHHSIGAQRLSYWLYLPDTPAPPSGYPLIVMLHGCEQSATLFAQGTRMNQVAGAAGYAVLYPQQNATAHPRRCWKWYDRAAQHGGGEVPLIVGAIDKVLTRYGMDRSRVYIGGLSAGAGMAHIVALNHPHLFAAVGLHSGPLYGAGHSTVGALTVMRHGALHRVDAAVAELRARQPGLPPLPTMLIQGADDDVVHPVNQVHLSRQARLLNGVPAATPVRLTRRVGSRRTLPHQIEDVLSGRKVILRVATIERLKHAWSGGDARLSFNSGTGPDASKMLLQFFSRHRRLSIR